MSKQGEPTLEVGRQVQRLRKERGWSAEVLAQRLSAELGTEVPGYIARRLERGERPITADEIAALVAIFEVSESALFGAETEESFYRQLQIKSVKDRFRTGQGHIGQGVGELEDVASDVRLILDNYRDLPPFTRGELRAVAQIAEEAVRANSRDSGGPVATFGHGGDDASEA